MALKANATAAANQQILLPGVAKYFLEKAYGRMTLK
jgi:hypothetical protein